MGSEEDPRDYDSARRNFKIGYIVATVSGAIMSLLMLSWVVTKNDEKTSYWGGGLTLGDSDKGPKEPENTKVINLHILMMTIFVVFLQGHSSLMFRIIPSFPKPLAKLVHAGSHLTTVVGMLVGFWIAIRYHDLVNKPHFVSLHSWIGLVAIILFYGQFVGGFSTFLLPWASMRIRTLVLPFHQAIGPLVFISCAVAAATGIMLKSTGIISAAPRDGSILTLNFAGMFLLIFTAAVVTLVYGYKYRRRPRPEDQIESRETEESDEEMQE